MPGFQTDPDKVDVDWIKSKSGWGHLYPNYTTILGTIVSVNPLAYTVQPDGGVFPNKFKDTCPNKNYSWLYKRSIGWLWGFGLTPGTLNKTLSMQQALNQSFVVLNPPTLSDKLYDFQREMEQTIIHGF